MKATNTRSGGDEVLMARSPSGSVPCPSPVSSNALHPRALGAAALRPALERTTRDVCADVAGPAGRPELDGAAGAGCLRGHGLGFTATLGATPPTLPRPRACEVPGGRKASVGSVGEMRSGTAAVPSCFPVDHDTALPTFTERNRFRAQIRQALEEVLQHRQHRRATRLGPLQVMLCGVGEADSAHGGGRVSPQAFEIAYDVPRRADLCLLDVKRSLVDAACADARAAIASRRDKPQISVASAVADLARDPLPTICNGSVELLVATLVFYIPTERILARTLPDADGPEGFLRTGLAQSGFIPMEVAHDTVRNMWRRVLAKLRPGVGRMVVDTYSIEGLCEVVLKTDGLNHGLTATKQALDALGLGIFTVTEADTCYILSRRPVEPRTGSRRGFSCCVVS